MGGGHSNIPRSKVIIVGGGYIGVEVAIKLDKHCDVTVIDPQDALHHKIASLRATVVPGWEKRLRIPLTNLLKNGKVLHDEVTSVSETTVTLKSGTSLTADFIILAHGGGPSNFPCGPLDGVTDSSKLVAVAKEKQGLISAAQTILIVGGGPVGVEMAGEIKAHHPTKTVHLVHSHDSLLNNSTPPILPTATMKLTELLKEQGVIVHLGVKVSDMPVVESRDAFVNVPKSYTLSDGTQITADMTIVTTGPPHTARPAPIIYAIDDCGHVKVNSNLQVEGYTKEFCVGDANNWPETKLALTGKNQAAHVVKNLLAQRDNKPMRVYKGLESQEYGSMSVPVGPRHGVTALNGSMLGNRATKIIKSKGLFSKATFESVGATLPAV